MNITNNNPPLPIQVPATWTTPTEGPYPEIENPTPSTIENDIPDEMPTRSCGWYVMKFFSHFKNLTFAPQKAITPYQIVW